MQSPDDDDEILDDKRLWLRLPRTQRFVTLLGRRKEGALHALLGACAATTDPSVAMLYGRYQSVMDSLDMLGVQESS